ncbi:MAG: intermembrane phospholipid transport protein YdbH family protein [Candidatus Paracaedibacter sp.]
MKQNFETLRSMRPYFKRGLVAFASIIFLSCGFLVWKGPTVAKNIAIYTLEQDFASLGIEEIEVDSVSFGWGRIYFRDIHTKTSSMSPSLSIQEMNVALSLFLKTKALDIVGATLQLTEGYRTSNYEKELREKVVQLSKVIEQIKHLKLPLIAMRDCLLVIPTLQGPLKIPVHAMTETNVKRRQVLTVDWGEQGDNTFSGQFILETGRNGLILDFHSANIDIQAQNFHVKSPEISLWSNSINTADEGHRIDVFVRLDHLMLKSFGTLKMPLEINVSAEGRADDLLLDDLRITGKEIEASLLELQGTLKPNDMSAQLDLTVQVPQLSHLWDFTPLLAAHATDKVSVEGKVSLAGEFLFEKGKLLASPLAIDIRKAALFRDDLSIEGVTSQLVFNTIEPLVTKGPQRILAKKITANGIDFRNINFEGLFDKRGLLQINGVSANTLNGSLKAHRFKRLVGVAYPAFQFETDFGNIELSEILKLTDLASLSGQAKLAGNASMRYGLKDGLDVIQAELHSISDMGLIQYKPETEHLEDADYKTQEVNMAFQVLNNLHFSLFNVRLSPMPDNPSEMQGIVKMLGSNPNVLNGYPFEFNIVTTGKLKDLVVNTLQHMKPPTDLKQLNQAIKATKDAKKAKELKRATGIKKASGSIKTHVKAKVIKNTKPGTVKIVKVFKKKKAKLKNRNRKMKDV